MIFFGAERMFTTILGKNIFLIPGEHISRRNMLPIFEKYAPNILEEIGFQYYEIILSQYMEKNVSNIPNIHFVII